jgi:hypothetical protein
MKLIAQKPCSFEGRKFFIGDEIPAELVANPKAQEKMGVLAIAADGGTVQSVSVPGADVKFEVVIHSDNGDLPLAVTNEELAVFTDILQTGVNKAEDKQKISDLIQKVDSEDLLIMLDALDGRKFVKEEAQARAEALTKPEETEEVTPVDGENPPEEPDTEPGGDE